MLALESLSFFDLLGPDHITEAGFLERFPNLTDLLLGELTRRKDLAQLLLSVVREAGDLLLGCLELASKVHFLEFNIPILVLLSNLKQHSVFDVSLLEVLLVLCFVLVAFGKEVLNDRLIALGQHAGF